MEHPNLGFRAIIGSVEVEKQIILASVMAPPAQTVPHVGLYILNVSFYVIFPDTHYVTQTDKT